MSIASQLSFSTATSVLAGTAGALLYQSAANTTAFLTIGTNGYVLTSNGSVPGWSLASGITSGASTQVQTVLQAANATYYPTFVNANNASATAMSVYTSSSFIINPLSGASVHGPGTGFVDSYGTANNTYKVIAYNVPTTSTNVDDVIRVVSKYNAAVGASAFPLHGVSIVFAGGIGDNQTRDRARLVAVYEGLNMSGMAIHTQSTADLVIERMRVSSGNSTVPGAVLIATTASTNANGILQVNGNLGMAPSTQIRQWTNADGGTLQLFATQVVTGSSNAISYSYTEGAYLASVSNGDSAILLDTGRANTLASGWARFRVVNQAGPNTSIQLSKGSTSTFYADTTNGYVGIGTTGPNTKLDVRFAALSTSTQLNHILLQSLADGVNNQLGARTGITFNNRTLDYVASGGLSTAGVYGVSTDNNIYARQLGLVFYTSAQDAAATEKLRITSAGGISFGTSGTAYGNSGDILKSNGDASPTWVAPSTVASGSATNADNIKTILQTGNASYYPVFVSANNAVAAYMPEYTTSSFNINPSTGNVSIGTTVAPGANGRGITIYTSDYPRLSFRNSTTGDATTDGSQLLVSGSDFYIQNQEAGALIFNTTSIERMRITAGGYIGIGNIASPGTLLSNTATRHGNADGLSAHLNAKQWEVNGQGYSSVVSNISAASANVNGGLLVKLGSTDVTDKILDLESGGVNRVRVLGNGNVGIGTGATAPAYKLEVNGSFAATTKSFVIDHPTKPGMKLRYGSLEGPENGVYVRGKLTGANTIELPEYWTKLVDPDSITVSLTSIGKHQDLFVADIANNVVTIGNGNILSKAINCFYVVYGERCDVDKLVVEI